MGFYGDLSDLLVECGYKNVIFTTHFPGNGLFIPTIYGDDWGDGL